MPSPYDAAYSALYSDLVTAAVTVSISSTTAASAQLAAGRHRVISDVDCYLRQGTSSVTATTSDTLVIAGQEIFIFVDATDVDDYLAGITGGASGTLFITPQYTA